MKHPQLTLFGVHLISADLGLFQLAGPRLK